ncbi:hypothetical protein PybrP1_007189 [[Pythium] brassicae (nom. inval.)]|nr:hypothetical protein PybrP1_007189 [[Pythium] brassicae (nom. inval.)]
MGAESSRVEAPSPVSWSTLQCGVHYSSSDVAVWPHLSPLAQWFTAQDALALRAKLHQRTSSSLLSFEDFVAWLQNGRRPVALHQPTMPVRHDVLTPAEFLSDRDLAKMVGAAADDPAATGMLEMYLEHVFHSLKDANASKVYAMEVLAALVLVSRAIWSFDEKVDVLMTLFCDPALSARRAVAGTGSAGLGHGASASSDRWFKETDVARLVLCAMRGVAKVTVGASNVWERRGVTASAVARKLSAACVANALAARKHESSHAPPSKQGKAASSPTRQPGGPRQQRTQHSTAFSSEGISAREFRQFVARRPVIQRFVALFAGEELRNPFTFAPLRSLGTGVPLPGDYRSALAKQTHIYHSLLQNYVTFEGRDALRRLSAVVLIQCAWRRRRSRTVLEQHRESRARQRHASAATLQGCLRQLQFAKVLEQHADAEREASNGGLFVAGSGPCVPRKSSDDGNASAVRSHPGLAVSATPLALVGEFKLRNVRISCVAASPNFAIAVAHDRETLFAWGRCLPCVYDGESSVRLFQPTPARLAHSLRQSSVDSGADAPAIVQIACGLQHALVLTDDGMVHSWGFNDHGQLGHGAAKTLEARTNGRTTYETHFDERDGRVSEFLPAPTRLVYFLGSPAQHADPIPVQQICCGDYYCMALSRGSDVFTWGEASEGQLGHGDAHTAFQVAFADVHMLNSAYTFLAQPEPVLALSDIEVAQVSCCKNHSAALARDGRVFEWGSWGKRRGRDMENAFVPVETERVQELRLRQLSVGDHHMLAEGSSVWMRLVTPTPAVGGSSDVQAVMSSPETDDSPDAARDELSLAQSTAPAADRTAFYLACAAYSCSFESVERFFASTSVRSAALTRRAWECTIVEFDVDDLEDDSKELPEPIGGDCVEASAPLEHGKSAGDVRSVWRKRVQQFALSVEQVGRFDTRVRQLRALSYRQNHGYSYEKLLTTWLLGHVENRFVAFPRGKPAGFYVQFLVPPASLSRADSEQRVESEQADGSAAPAVVEFRVCGSSTAERAVRKRGFAVHAFHPHMEDAKLTKIQRKKRKHLSVVTGENSLFILEFDASCLPSTADAFGNCDDSTSSGDDEAAASAALGGLIVGEMTARVLAAQESGVLAVLIVLDLFNAEPFELQFGHDSGVYIPVLMVNRFALATHAHNYDSVSGGARTSLHELLELMLAASDDDGEREAPPSALGAALPPMHRAASSRFVSRPLWTARCFRRVDTLSARVRCALANGAAGVILIQDSESVEMDGETRGAPQRFDDRLIAMISHEEGSRLRAASRMTICEKYMPLLSRDGSNYELVADVAFEVRPGGTTYAWGNAQNGRLGAGPSPCDVYQDGYEALTDTTYRFLERPMPVVTLAGIEMRQLACGAAHSLAVTAEGSVFAWGRGSRGALALARGSKSAGTQRHGMSDEAMRDLWVPKRVHGLRFEHIVQAAANDGSSLFLTETVDSALYRERRRVVAQLKAVARRSLQTK